MSEKQKNEIYLSPAPHYAAPVATRQIMLFMVACLLPLAAYGVWLFGLPALVTILVSVASTVLFEALFRLAIRQDIRTGDFSSVVTGLLLALTLPPTTPVWMTALGALFAVVVAKEFFGGLGANVFNPALSGRAFLLVSFSTPMTTWIAPRISGAVDAVSAATPLSFLKSAEGAIRSSVDLATSAGFASKSDLYWNLFLGRRAGCIGESAIFLILIIGLVLMLSRMIDWRAPVAMIVTAVAVTWIAGVDPLLTLLSGGLLFGAFFMATDYSTTPVTPAGRLIFGAGCGLIAGLIRVFGGYPEGVMFSILIMNAVVPFLNKILSRQYGHGPKPKAEAKK